MQKNTTKGMYNMDRTAIFWRTIEWLKLDIHITLLQIGPFVPVLKGYLSRFWNRDSAAGTKALEAFVPDGRTGTKCPSP